LWGLPLPIVEAVAFHHNPSAAMENGFDIPSAVSLANFLVNPANNPADFRGHLQSLKVADKLDGWTAIARREMEQVSTHRTVRV